MTDRLTHAAESAHWYDPRTVTPVYEVPNAKGDKLIKPDVRHARKLGLVPGVTGIISMIARPALENWKIEQAMWAALTLPRGLMESDKEFMNRVLEDGRRQAEEAAEAGTKIHAAIQSFYSGEAYDETLRPYVQGVVKTIGSRSGWETEKTCAHPLGFATKADLCSPNWVIDFKSKEFSDIESLKLYDNHYMQLAATRAALGGDYEAARCAIVWVSRDNPGLCHITDAPEDQLTRGWQMFQAAHRLWCLQRKYEPSKAFKRSEP